MALHHVPTASQGQDAGTSREICTSTSHAGSCCSFGWTSSGGKARQLDPNRAKRSKVDVFTCHFHQLPTTTVGKTTTALKRAVVTAPDINIAPFITANSRIKITSRPNRAYLMCHAFVVVSQFKLLSYYVRDQRSDLIGQGQDQCRADCCR